MHWFQPDAQSRWVNPYFTSNYLFNIFLAFYHNIKQMFRFGGSGRYVGEVRGRIHDLIPWRPTSVWVYFTAIVSLYVEMIANMERFAYKISFLSKFLF